jgi:hypothetical protein
LRCGTNAASMALANTHFTAGRQVRPAGSERGTAAPSTGEENRKQLVSEQGLDIVGFKVVLSKSDKPTGQAIGCGGISGCGGLLGTACLCTRTKRRAAHLCFVGRGKLAYLKTLTQVRHLK